MRYESAMTVNLYNNIAIELGISRFLVYTEDKGIVFNEPSLVLIDRDKNIFGIGIEANEKYKINPYLIRVFPLNRKNENCLDLFWPMVKYFIGKLIKLGLLENSRLNICIPSFFTTSEKTLIKSLFESAGAKIIYFIGSPMAAAVGAGISVLESSGIMIVDIGRSITEIAVISFGSIAFTTYCIIGGERFDEYIIAYLKNERCLLTGLTSAEKLKIAIGSVSPFDEERSYEIKGRDTKNIDNIRIDKITSEEIREYLWEYASVISDMIKIALEEVTSKLAADIASKGIVLAGGGSKLAGLDIFIREKTGLQVRLAEDPSFCCIRGASQALKDVRLLRKVATLDQVIP
jgi:rod shape-determining protein MreB and related proteins